MSNDMYLKLIDLIENADYGNTSISEYIKTMGISGVIAKQLIQNGLVIEETQKSGTSFAKPKSDSNQYSSKTHEQKRIMYELAEERAPIVFSTENELSSFLDLMSKFPNYTATNLLLLSAQNPQASILKTFDEWDKEGYNIKKFQKGIKLFQFEGKKTDKNGKPYNDFSIKNVFDIEQTDCDTKASPIPYDSKLLFTAMLKGTSTPIKPVEHEVLPSGYSAYFDEKQNTILIAKDLPFCVQFNTLCCELLLSEIKSRDRNYTRARYETDCICASYVISKKYGIDTSYFDLNNVCNIINNKDGVDIRKTIERIRSNVNSAVSRINTHIERTQGREMVL